MTKVVMIKTWLEPRKGADYLKCHIIRIGKSILSI